MSDVEAFEIEGFKLRFYSNDHTPPHFHAKKRGEWEIKIEFMAKPSNMVRVCWIKKQPSARMVHEICLLAETHRSGLLEQWERINGTGVQE